MTHTACWSVATKSLLVLSLLLAGTVERTMAITILLVPHDEADVADVLRSEDRLALGETMTRESIPRLAHLFVEPERVEPIVRIARRADARRLQSTIIVVAEEITFNEIDSPREKSAKSDESEHLNFWRKAARDASGLERLLLEDLSIDANAALLFQPPMLTVPDSIDELIDQLLADAKPAILLPIDLYADEVKSEAAAKTDDVPSPSNNASWDDLLTAELLDALFLDPNEEQSQVDEAEIDIRGNPAESQKNSVSTRSVTPAMLLAAGILKQIGRELETLAEILGSADPSSATARHPQPPPIR